MLGEVAIVIVEQSKEVVFAERDDMFVVDRGRASYSTLGSAVGTRIGDALPGDRQGAECGFRQ